ncbi:MAG: putative flippase GtrA [Cyclobacteriaceae bacterium]|jgi:putative flippase GtrA
MIQSFLISIIDRFYFIFRPFMPLKIYRYAACGGSNLVLDSVLYFVLYNFVLAKKNLDLGIVVLSPHIAALFIVFPITSITGFLLNKYISFQGSNLKSGVQLYRYVLVIMGGVVLSYACMKFFVDWMEIYPTPSRILTIVIAVIYSYKLQRSFTFKVKEERAVD